MTAPNPITDNLAEDIRNRQPSIDESLPEQIRENQPSVTEDTPDQLEDAQPTVEDAVDQATATPGADGGGADCAFADIACKTTEALNGANEKATADIKEATEMVVEGTFTGWLHAPVPFISDTEGIVSFLRMNTDWITVILFGIGVLIFAFGLVLKPNKQTISGGTSYMARVIVVAGGSITIAAMLIHFCDGFSTWIIDQALQGDDLASTILNTFQVTGPTGFLVALIFGGCVLAMSAIQGFMLIIRNAALPILVAMSPLVASIANTKTGESWWNKYLSWFTAMLLYKPTAAIIYAGGFWMLANGNILEAENVTEAAFKGMNWMYGMALLLMAVFTFWALLNVVTPVVGKISGGGGGLAMVGASAAALGVSGIMGRPKAINPPPAPNIRAPSNQAAGAPPTGTRGTPTRGTPGPAGPAGQAAKVGVQAAQSARRGVANGINNDKSED